MLRCLAVIALATSGVIVLALPAVAQNSVSVAKQPTPQLLAPSQPQPVAPATQVQNSAPPAPQQQETPPAPAPSAAAAPVEVPIERYTRLRPAIPVQAEDEQAMPQAQGGFTSADRLMD